MASLYRYRFEILAAGAITLVYFVTRVYNLLGLPVFTDEAIYMRWAQYFLSDSKFWDYSITDGKQPLYIWLVTTVMTFIKDPLLAGRLVSVLAGFVTTVGLFFLGRKIFKNKWIGFITAGLYVLYPFGLVYDRMALYDSLVGTFTVWGYYFVIQFVRRNTMQTALLLGVSGGLGALNKSNGAFAILLLPLSLLVFDINKKKRNERLLRWIGLSVLAGVITFGIYSLLRLSPFFHIIEQKNGTFVYPFAEWIQHPFKFFWGNLWAGQRDWLIKYFGYTFLILTTASFFVKRAYTREKLLLVLWFIAPFFALALFGKTLYPRYILFMTISLLPLVAYSLYYAYGHIKHTPLYLIFLVAVLYLPVSSLLMILNDFSSAPIPLSDKEQYNNDWPSGVGIPESVAFFKQEASKGKIAILTEGTFGLMPYAYELYLHDNKNVTIQGFWPVDDAAKQAAVAMSKKMPTYVIFYQPCPSCSHPGAAPVTWPLEKVREYTKVKENTSLTVYRVKQ